VARAAYDKKNKHRCQLALAPAGYFTAVLSVFQAHLPVHDLVSHAKPLDWKARARNQTIQTCSMVILDDPLDSYSMRCNRLRGC
jgi:hypothetical protein